jgi:hypothetical protein
MENMGRFRKEEINREFFAGEKESVQDFAKALYRGEIGNAKLGHRRKITEKRSDRRKTDGRKRQDDGCVDQSCIDSVSQISDSSCLFQIVWLCRPGIHPPNAYAVGIIGHSKSNRLLKSKNRQCTSGNNVAHIGPFNVRS